MKDLTIEKYFEGELYYDDCGAKIFLKKPDGQNQHIADVRGFGCISKHFNYSDRKAIPFQDSVGEFIVKSIEEKLGRASNAIIEFGGLIVNKLNEGSSYWLNMYNGTDSERLKALYYAKIETINAMIIEIQKMQLEELQKSK